MSCHCGAPVVYSFDGDPTHHRGMCSDCDSVRCDAYPGECSRPEARPVRGGSLFDMAWELKPAAETGDDCMVDARSVYDALMAAHAELENLRFQLRTIG